MAATLRLALAVLLTLVPVTLLVPGLEELVVDAHGGTRLDAHLFMAVNTLAGIVAVPFAMRLLRRAPDVRRWIVLALVGDALAFAAMGLAPSVEVLLVARAVEGATHLPAVALLMVAITRLGGRRGRAMGFMGAALMGGVTIGGGIGGWLVERGTGAVYASGAALLLVAALLAATVRPPRVEASPPRAAAPRRSTSGRLALGFAFADRFSIGVFVSTFTLYVAEAHGMRPTERGLLVALFMLPFVALCVPAGWLVDRIGARVPLAAGTFAFGGAFATYGLADARGLPPLMVLSGVASAAMFAALLVLVADAAAAEGDERLFGDFHVAGSLGFLAGPVTGGLLVELTRGGGRPAYEVIFAGTGLLLALLGLVALRVLPGRRTVALLSLERAEDKA